MYTHSYPTFPIRDNFAVQQLQRSLHVDDHFLTLAFELPQVASAVAALSSASKIFLLLTTFKNLSKSIL